jgi:hypothetical protein
LILACLYSSTIDANDSSFDNELVRSCPPNTSGEDGKDDGDEKAGLEAGDDNDGLLR